MNRAASVCGFLFVSIALIEARSDEPPPPTLLIIPFENATGDSRLDALKRGVPDLLTAFLAPNEGEIQVLDREALEKLFAESSLSWQGFLKAGSDVKLGQLSQAKFVLRGSVAFADRVGEEKAPLVVDAFLYETETTRLVKTFSAAGRAEDLTKLCQTCASKIASFFEARVDDLVELPDDDDPQRNLALIHGLGHFHNGQYHKALSFFFKMLENDPDDELARYWVARSFLAAGMADHARLEFRDLVARFPEGSKADEARRYLEKNQGSVSNEESEND